MKSIHTMIVGIFFIFSIIISTMLIIVSYVGINDISNRDNDRIMELIIEERKNDIESMMDDVSRSLDNTYYFAKKELDRDIDRVSDPAFREEYLEKIKDMALVEASSAGASTAVYMRFTDDIKEDPVGFLYRKNPEGTFEKLTLTDISAYDKNDLNHVGWYYIPQRSKSPVWIGPYRNDNLGIEIISYITPLYQDGEFVGIVGMDMEVESFRDCAEKIRVYETGSAVLFDAEDNIVYARDA